MRGVAHDGWERDGLRGVERYIVSQGVVITGSGGETP